MIDPELARVNIRNQDGIRGVGLDPLLGRNLTVLAVGTDDEHALQIAGDLNEQPLMVRDPSTRRVIAERPTGLLKFRKEKEMPTGESEPDAPAQKEARAEEVSQPTGYVALEGAIRTQGVIDVHELDIEQRRALNERGGVVLAWSGYGMID